MTTSTTWPPWLDKVVKGGGYGAALIIVWFVMIQPMREAFATFQVNIRTDLKGIEHSVEKNGEKIGELRDTLNGALSTRLTKVEATVAQHQLELNKGERFTKEDGLELKREIKSEIEEVKSRLSRLEEWRYNHPTKGD